MTYCARSTVKEAEEQMRKATAEGMREIAVALAKKRVLSEFDSDSDSESDSSAEYINHFGKPTKSVNLETRIHYLKLDLSNAKVEIDDIKSELTLAKQRINTYNEINKELSVLASYGGWLLDANSLTIKQLQLKHTSFIQDTEKHITLCDNAIKMCDLADLKNSLSKVLAIEKERVIAIEKSFKWIIEKKMMINAVIDMMILISTVIISISVLLYFKII